METVFAFGFGIMLVCTIVLIDIVVQSKKKIEKLESQINSTNNHLSDVIKVMNNSNTSLQQQLDSLDKKHSEQNNQTFSDLNQKIEFFRRAIGRGY